MEPIRILFITDSRAEVESATRLLEDAKIAFTPIRIQTEKGLEKSLKKFDPHVVITSCSTAKLDGKTALKMVLEYNETIPVILISSAINETMAIECMKAGAIDFVLKEHISRLPFSVKGALNLRTSRIEKENTLKDLARERDLFQTIADTSPAGIVMVDETGNIHYVNRLAAKILGYSKQDISIKRYNSPEWKITAIDGNPFPEDQLPFVQVKRKRKTIFDIRHAIEWPDRKRICLSINATPLETEGKDFAGMLATVQDITEMLAMQKNLQKVARKYREQSKTLRKTNREMAEARVVSQNMLNDLIKEIRVRDETRIALRDSEDKYRILFENYDQRICSS